MDYEFVGWEEQDDEIKSTGLIPILCKGRIGTRYFLNQVFIYRELYETKNREELEKILTHWNRKAGMKLCTNSE